MGTRYLEKWLRQPGATTRAGRAQSEPLAALVSVAVVCLVVSLSVGVFTDIIGKTGDERSVGEPTADAVWEDISQGGSFDSDLSVETAVDYSSLPDGHYVAVTVTYVNEQGVSEQVDRATFGPDGVKKTKVPAGAETVERPISVKLGPGDREPGRLTIEVWQ